uniref:E3 ubiquitin-protein ligase RNF181 n=1 Tax=Eptatretus burgeri TaxID=7764 RepID=A0A8C4WRT7_EPTBU
MRIRGEWDLFGSFAHGNKEKFPRYEKKKVSMASYFDEHAQDEDEERWEEEESLIRLARLILRGLGLESAAAQLPPPASQAAILALRKRSEGKGGSCPVCLAAFADDGEDITVLPCNHSYHTACISTWLHKTCSCPVCRFELPTDDVEYEETKKEKIG